MTGCSDPVYDDLQNFLNIEMTDINENYEKIKTEAAKWENFEEDTEFVSSLKDTLLPLVNDSLKKLESVNPETDEVKEFKDMYINMMNAYKEGFDEILTGFQESDADVITSGNEKLNNGLKLLEEYNEAVEDLAEISGLEIVY